MAELPSHPEGIVLAHFIVSDDVESSRRFYTEVLGGRMAFTGEGGDDVDAAAETASVRDPLLHARSRRSSDRSGSNN